MNTNLSVLFPLGIYFAVILALGWRRRVFETDESENYLLVGRQLTLPGFVLSLVSSWYGGILGSSEYSYSYGFSNWLVFGFPYYVFAGLFAVFLAKRAREKFVVSIPDLIAEKYGETCRIPAGFLVLILASPAPYVLTLGVLFHFVLGVPVVWGIIGGAVFSFAYVYRDGLSVILRTDFFQCILMYVGYGLLISFAWIHWGSPLKLFDEVSQRSPMRVEWDGGQPVSYLLVWFFIASWTLVSPMFHQRVYALKDKKNAKRGIFLSVLLWGVFDLFTTLAGLYAFAYFPELADARLSHLQLAEHLLPGLALGIFLVGLFAVVMSTLDSELFVSGVTLGNDLLLRRRIFQSWRVAQLTRLGMGIVMIASVALAILMPSVVDLYFTIGTFAVPGLLYPVLSSIGLFPQLRRRAMAFYLWGVPVVSLSWFLWGLWVFPWMASVEAFYPGVVFGLIICIVDRSRSDKGNVV